jgi:hypothetical protein
MAKFDTFNKAPGLYVTEEVSPPPPPAGIAVGSGGMFGVTKWGPIGLAVLCTSFAQWTRIFGAYISEYYPAYKQVKKFFQNGGSRLWFVRVVHYADPTDASSYIATKAVGYLYDDAMTPASIGAPVAGGGNAGDETASEGGIYTGTEDGSFRVEVTTGGVYSTGEVTIYFTPDGGSEAMVGTFIPVSGSSFDLDNGATLTLTDGGDGNLTLGDEWTVAVTAEKYTEADRRIIVNALYAGALGNDLSVRISAGSLGVTGEFKLDVLLSGGLVETWDNLSLDVDAGNYFINAVNGQSRYTWLEDTANINDLSLTQNDAVLSGGDDGLTGLVDADYIGDEIAETGIQALRVVTYEPLNIGCPDSCIKDTALIRKEVCRFVDNDMDTSFGILVAPRDKIPSEIETFQENVLATDSPRAALYYPWVVDDEDNEVISPLGMLMGLYARFASAGNKGIWYSPAGTDANLLGTSGLERLIADPNLGRLNEKRVCCLKNISGRGAVVWGARTLAIAKAADFKYIGARLNTSNIEMLIFKNTLWAPLRPNDATLWEDISNTINSILNTRYLEGGLDGDTVSEAYGVRCDASVNTQQTKNQGLVICKVGIRNKQTAEFIWFNVTQFASGGTITE